MLPLLINCELGGVRTCQYGCSCSCRLWASSLSLETFGWRHGGFVCCLLQLLNQPAWKSHAPEQKLESRSVFQKCFFPQSISGECDWSNRNPCHMYSVTQAANTEWPVSSLRTGKLNCFNLIPVVQTSLKGVKFGSFSQIILRGKKPLESKQQSNWPASDSYLSKNTRVQWVIKNSQCER